MRNWIAAIFMIAMLFTVGCSSKAQSDSGCKVTPPTTTFKATDGATGPVFGSEQFYFRDGGQPWLVNQPHKIAWFYPKSDQARELKVSGDLITTAGDKAAPVILLQQQIEAGADSGRATDITIPKPGCWTLSADRDGQKLNVVISAVPLLPE